TGLARVWAACGPAGWSPSGRRAQPVPNSKLGPPERSPRAAWASASGETPPGARAGGTSAGPEPSFHAVSAGSIRVAIWPGGVRAAAIAAAPSAATQRPPGEVLTRGDNRVAAVSMSKGGGASYRRGERARTRQVFSVGVQ